MRSMPPDASVNCENDWDVQLTGDGSAIRPKVLHVIQAVGAPAQGQLTRRYRDRRSTRTSHNKEVVAGDREARAKCGELDSHSGTIAVCVVEQCSRSSIVDDDVIAVPGSIQGEVVRCQGAGRGK